MSPPSIHTAPPQRTAEASASQVPSFDVNRLRQDFPILSRVIHGKPLVYLDNAATTQKPRTVIDTIRHYYEAENSNIHRGVYTLSQEATAAYEAAREKVRSFINAAETREIIFTRGTTEAINLVASSYGRTYFKPGDEIILSEMEHHSNIVPWQIICEQTGAVLRVVPFNERGELMMDEYERLLSDRTKFVSIVHVSNSLGTINPVKKIIDLAHGRGAAVLIDGAQWVAHGLTDVRALDADFYAFSGHKLYGPTGIGILYGKARLLDAMPPYQGGGDMISSVTFAKTTYNDLPHKFEAGTPNIAGGIGLGAAIDYVQSIGLEAIALHESELLRHAVDGFSHITGVRPVGAARNRAGVVSFVVEEPPLSAFDLGFALDLEGIAIRTGHHCCQPVMDRFKVPGTARASFAMYNTLEEVDKLVAGIRNAIDYIVSDTKAHGSASTAIQFPEPSAESPEAAADELAESFELLDEPDARNQYLLDLARRLPPMPEGLKMDATRVHGCMSKVHLFGKKRSGPDARLDFIADSDAHIVQGLIALLEKLFAGQKAADILAFDVEKFFARIGLNQFIGTQRRNGLAGMVKRIRELATAISA